MKKYLLHIVLIICLTFQGHSQEEGVVVAYNLPVRTSLKFNKHLINPTFSFVREQNKYISFTNKREWGQFENAPETYIFGYAGRFKENIGAGLSLFQQNYGVLTTFGGVANFAYNVAINRESNLTFGMNLGAYSSGLNQGKVVSNFPDPSLDNIPSNLLITINPGINYGVGFVDFGLSINNLVSYNFTNSSMVEDNPEQGIQVHGMYTGYFNSRGFFDESKFSALVRSEFKKDQTIISGLMMVSVPKGFWGQVGYNTLYGVSAGVGLNISSQISIEYNFEKAIGDLSTLGNAHDITLAYRFKNNDRYDYSGDDDEQALLIQEKKKSNVARRNRSTKPDPRKIPEKAKDNSSELAAAAIVAKQKKEPEDKASGDVEQEAKLKAEQEAQELAEAERLKAEEAALALAEANRFKAEQEAKLKAEQEAQALAEAERLKAEEAALALAEANRLKVEQEAKLKAEREVQALVEAERLEAEEAALALAEANRLKAEQEAKLKAEQEAKVLAEADEEDIDTGIVPTDAASALMNDITKEAVESNKEQEELLSRLTEKVNAKQKDLDDLIIENDLSEQGIVKAPKPFKSVSAENREMEELTESLNKVIEVQNENIRRLDKVYKERLEDVPDEQDPTNRFYKQKIKDLKSEQLRAIQLRQRSLLKIDELKEEIKIEKKRRIKRALYENTDDRYAKDRATLKTIKETTPVSSKPLKADDFNYGERLNNIQIIQNVKNVESGYYLVVAVHSNMEKRDEFLKKAVAAGESNINFFYDVNSSKYYIYYEKHTNINDAQNTMASKGSKPYNGNMSMVKIEN